MDCSVTAITISVVLPEIFSNVALIIDEPIFMPFARPFVEIAATEVVSDDHITEIVMSCDVLSEYFPVAANCFVTPTGIDGLTGVTAMDLSFAAVTVMVVLPEMFPDVALMTDDPALMLVTSPFAETAATEVVSEVHVTEVVIFCDVPSEYVPVAVN